MWYSIVKEKQRAKQKQTDVRTDAWYFEAINFVTDRSYFVGVSDTLFGPEIQMTRAMFVTVLGLSLIHICGPLGKERRCNRQIRR